MSAAPARDSVARRLFGALTLAVAAFAIIASYVGLTHTYPPPRWTDAATSSLFAILGLQYLLFPKDWQLPGISRWIVIVVFFAVSASTLYIALKG